MLKGLRKRVCQDQLELANPYIDKARVTNIDPDKLKQGFSKSIRYDALLNPKKIVDKHEEPVMGLRPITFYESPHRMKMLRFTLFIRLLASVAYPPRVAT